MLNAKLRRKLAGRPALSVIAGGALIGISMLPLIVHAQTNADNCELPRTIVVTGEGVVQAMPDLASVFVGIVTQSDTVREAVSANTEATSAVIAAFRQTAIETRDLETSGFSVQPRYIYPKNGSGEPPRINGYEVRNTLTIRVRDLRKLGEALDTAIKAGSNQINGISFGVADDAILLDTARRKAIEDARRKAEILASAAGVSLGRVMVINNGSFEHPQPRSMMIQAVHADALSAREAVPIEAGEQEFRASVSMTWELTD